MTLRSVLRLRKYSIRSERHEPAEGILLKLILRNPIRGELLLRERGSDILTFTEVIEHEIYRDVLVMMRDCKTIVDLGANIGLASRYFADHFPHCKILAVEPNPSTYRILLLNVQRLVSTGRCRTLQAAVWASETPLAAGVGDAPAHYSAFSVRETTADSAHHQITGWPMTKIIAHSGFATIDLLKVDIEGAEVELFKGRSDWLERVKTIAIEFHANSREDSRFDDLMSRYGFRVVDRGSHTVLALKRVDA